MRVHFRRVVSGAAFFVVGTWFLLSVVPQGEGPGEGGDGPIMHFQPQQHLGRRDNDEDEMMKMMIQNK